MQALRTFGVEAHHRIMERLSLHTRQPCCLSPAHALERIGNGEQAKHGAVIVLAVCPLPGARTRPGAYLFGAFGEPLGDFFHRYRGVAALILAGGPAGGPPCC